jgi:hypothetical protein
MSRRKTNIHLSELFPLLAELGSKEFINQLEEGLIVNNQNPLHIVFLKQVIDQKVCPCQQTNGKEAGVVIHTNHILDPNFKILMYWDRTLSAWSIISGSAKQDEKLHDVCHDLARTKFNIISNEWYQLMAYSRRVKHQVIDSEVWITSTNSIKSKMINLDNQRCMDPTFMPLQEAVKVYDDMSPITQLAINKVLEIRGESISYC